jgi:Zn-finger nucleic acid-binding protein
MDCPACKNAMITLELDSVEIDHCLSCGGIWLDGGELEHLIGQPDQVTALLNSFGVANPHGEKKRRCPICDRPMAKIQVGKDNTSVIIDRCQRAHGLWFDAGELDEVLERAQLDTENKIRKLLADMFGKNDT